MTDDEILESLGLHELTVAQARDVARIVQRMLERHDIETVAALRAAERHRRELLRTDW